MPISAPQHCHPAAYELFADQMSRLKSSDALMRAAVAIAMHEQHDCDPDSIDIQIETIAADVFSRLNHREPHAILAHTHVVLFDEMRFAGDTTNYYNPQNSYLPSVLDRRIGNPIMLSMIYKAVLERVGLRAVGINAPTHFLVRVDIDAAPMYVDAFHGGRSMTGAEAVERLESMLDKSLAEHDDILPEATHTQWLARMLNNLVHLFGGSDRQSDAAAMLELAGLLREAPAPGS